MVRGGVLAGLADSRICAVMLSLNDNGKLYMANNKNLKFHHCREFPKFSGQHSSAIDLPTRRKNIDSHIEKGLQDKIYYRASILVLTLDSKA